MTINAIRQALSDACDTIDGLRATPLVTDQIATNQAVVVRGEIDYDLVFSGAKQVYNIKIVVYANRTAERASQLFLDNLCEPTGATSLKRAIESNAGVAAVCDYADVKTASAVGVATVGTTDYLTVEFTLEVCAP